MLKVLNRAGRLFLAEWLVLFPGLLFVTERLSRRGWDGGSQVRLFYGTLGSAAVATIALMAILSNWLDRRCTSSKYVAKLLDGDGVLGLCVCLAGTIALIGDLALHPARAKALFGGGQTVVAESSAQESSISPDLQEKTKAIIAEGVSEYGADSGCAIVMDITTGWILAAATAGATNDESLLTRAQEMGSVVAPLAVAAAIESDPMRYGPETEYNISREDPHYEELPGDPGHQWFQTMTLRDAVARSSNILLGKLAWDVGHETLFESYSRFGLGCATGVWGEDEPTGILPDPRQRSWSAEIRSRMGIGHGGLTATPIQIVSAYQALANKGVRLKPQLTREPPQEISRPVSSETAAKVLEMMTTVVDKGTARRAQIDGVRVAGKTGTSMKQADGVPTSNQYLASFIGVAPADDPEFVAMVLVVVNKEVACHQGGNTAAPIWRKIAIEALRQDAGVSQDRP